MAWQDSPCEPCKKYKGGFRWIRERGPIPPGLWVCHACDNPYCSNLEHMFLGTPSDDMKDCVQKGRHRGGWCQPKLTNELVLEIRNSDKSTLQWSKELGISYPTIHRARFGTSWKHLNDQSLPKKRM